MRNVNEKVQWRRERDTMICPVFVFVTIATKTMNATKAIRQGCGGEVEKEMVADVT